MVSNIEVIDGHPYVRDGADTAELAYSDGRVQVVTNRAITFSLERSVDGGVTWETVLADTLSGDGANLVDWESLSNGTTQYRAVAFTVEGATAETIITVVADSDAVWLSGGPSFGVAGRLPFNPAVQHTAGRQRALKQYAGRSLPVALSGEALARVVAVSGVTFDDQIDDQTTADVEQLTQISQAGEPVFLFRDPDGRRIYGTIDKIDMSRKGSVGKNGMWGYSFTLTEADRTSA